MSFTYEQIEAIADHMRSAGFDASEMDNEEIGLLASCVLEALGINIWHTTGTDSVTPLRTQPSVSDIT